MTNRKDVVSACAMAVAMFVQPALAQSAPAQPDASQTGATDAGSAFTDIVVTARKVQESSQSLPITVAAFSGQELTNKVVLNVRDLQAVTPGLTVSANAQGGAPIFAIRGTATENLIDGGVALYLNDVAMISSLGLVNQFFDVSTVEILKGPQGTQFGTNTTGGTISVRTNEPTDKLEAFLKAGYGSYDRKELEGMVNLPASDVLRFRFAGQWVKRDGYIDNPLGSGVIPKTFGDEDHYALRGSMLLDAGPASNLLVVDYYHRDETPIQQVPVAYGANAQGIQVDNLGTDLNGKDLSAFNQRLGDRTTVYIGPDISGKDRALFERARIWGAQDRLLIEASDNLTIRNVAGYRHEFTDSSENNMGNTLNLVNVQTQTTVDQWSDDFTLQYKSDDNRLRLSAGGYWQWRKKVQGTIANVIQATFLKFGIPDFGIPPGPLVANIVNFTDQTFDTKAIYANGEFDVTPTLTVNGGFRYNWDSSRLQYFAGQGVGLPLVTPDFLPSATNPCNVAGLASFTNKNLGDCYGLADGKWRAPSWTVGVTNRFSPRILAYAKVSHGYLAGGLNATVREVLDYKPETKTEYEVGLKADWSLAGRPLRTNVAAFYNRTRNKQVVQNTNYDDGGSGNGVFNAAEETVYGLDLETRFSPVDGLTLEANYNYVHAKFNNFLFPAIGGNGDGKTGSTLQPAADLSGNTPAQTPRHQLNLAGTWELPLPETAGRLSATVSGYYTSAVAQSNVLSPFNAAFGLQYNTIQSYWLVNASANWASIMGSPVSAQVFVRNLFDRTYVTFRNDQFQSFSTATAIYGMPRTFGVAASVRF